MDKDAQIVVAGLVLRLCLNEAERNESPPLAGPLIFAGTGAFLFHAQVQLFGAVPAKLKNDDFKLLRRLDPEGRMLHQLSLPALVLISDRILGENNSSRIVGDPAVWRAPFSPDELNGQILVLANADPCWYEQILTSCNPRLVAMDVHGEWVTWRASSLNTCLRRANIITITEQDLKKLPKSVLSGVRAGHESGRALIIKRGQKGISVFAGGQEVDLPAPKLDSDIQTDVGAGDFLLGALVGCLSRETNDLTLRDFKEAYDICSPLLSALLTSRNSIDFLRRSLCLI
jgi:hypothetical protein